MHSSIISYSTSNRNGIGNATGNGTRIGTAIGNGTATGNATGNAIGNATRIDNTIGNRFPNRFRNRFRAAVLSLIAALVPSALPAQENVVRFDTVRQPDIHIFSSLYFKFDNATLNEDYMTNRQSLESLRIMFDTLKADNLESINVVSQSSPEGVYEYNVNLSKRRSDTMSRYMSRNYPNLVDRMNIAPNGESWAELREYVLTDTCLSQESKQRITDLIDSNIDITLKKERIQKLGTDPAVGSIYSYIYSKYYKIIRYSGIEIILKSYRTVPVCPVIEEQEAPSDSVAEIVPSCQTDCIETQAPAVLVQHTDSTIRIPALALKTNLLYNAFFIPGDRYSPITNAVLEFYFPRSNWSALGEMEFPWWSNERNHYYFQFMNWQLEGRCYLADGHNHTGHYLSLYGMYNMYDFCSDNNLGKGIQGEGAGAGIGYGFVKHIGSSRRFKLEFFVKAGYYESHYDRYETNQPHNGNYYYEWTGDPNAFRPRNHRFRWFGPTGAGISLSYDITRKVRSDFYENHGKRLKDRQ